MSRTSPILFVQPEVPGLLAGYQLRLMVSGINYELVAQLAELGQPRIKIKS